MVHKWSSCSEYTTDSIKYFVLVLERVRTVYRRNDIAVRTHMSTKQIVNSSVHHILFVYLYVGSVLFCEQKWTWILVSFVNGKRFIPYSHLPDILWTLVLNTFLQINFYISARIWSIPVLDWVPLFRYRIGSGIDIFVHSGTGAWPDARQSGIQAF